MVSIDICIFLIFLQKNKGALEDSQISVISVFFFQLRPGLRSHDAISDKFLHLLEGNDGDLCEGSENSNDIKMRSVVIIEDGLELLYITAIVPFA